MVSLKIDFRRKDFVWVGLFIILISIGIGVALNSGDYQVMGHTADEIEGVCLTNGTGCPIGLGATNTYDSGWFPVENRKSYELQHNLGHLPVTILVYYSTNGLSDGGGRQVTPYNLASTKYTGYLIDNYGSETTSYLFTAYDYVNSFKSLDGGVVKLATGYYRVFMT